MQNMLNYQATYGAAPPPSTPLRIDLDAPLFASEDGLVASLSNQECIFLVKRNSEQHVMTFQVLQALDQCREFRSLDEHIARIQSTITGLAGKRDDVKRVLESLIQRKLLVSEAQFIERTQAAPKVLAPLRAVFIRACDSPVELNNLLLSLTDYERKFRANRHYVVLDDSALPVHVDEQRDLLREFARSTGCKASYVGAAERMKLVAKLSKAVPQAKNVLPRLLLREAHAQTARFGGGRGKNLALLLGAGARLALLDDDMRLPLKRPEFAVSGLDPNPAARATVRFHANTEEALSSGIEIERDPFELHLDACGQNLGALPEYTIGHGALRGMNLGRLSLLSDRAQVITTHHGVYGSSGAEGGAWLYDLDAQSRAEFWRDRSSYVRNTEAQFIWFGVAQARAVEVAGFTAFTMDDSVLLPCTNPVGRAEDCLVSALTHFCHPDAIALELPEAIGHLQDIPRKRSAKAQAGYTPAFNHFLHEYVQRQFGQCKAADPAQRMAYLSAMLHDFAGASSADRIAHLRQYLSYERADVIDRLQHQLDEAIDAPVYWQADVRAIIQANAKSLLAKVAPRLSDWADDVDENECSSTLARELNNVADALEHWPALWKHAAEQGDKLLTAL